MEMLRPKPIKDPTLRLIVIASEQILLRDQNMNIIILLAALTKYIRTRYLLNSPLLKWSKHLDIIFYLQSSIDP
jgi:hypothetical protein